MSCRVQIYQLSRSIVGLYSKKAKELKEWPFCACKIQLLVDNCSGFQTFNPLGKPQCTNLSMGSAPESTPHKFFWDTMHGSCIMIRHYSFSQSTSLWLSSWLGFQSKKLAFCAYDSDVTTKIWGYYVALYTVLRSNSIHHIINILVSAAQVVFWY